MLAGAFPRMHTSSKTLEQTRTRLWLAPLLLAATLGSGSSVPANASPITGAERAAFTVTARDNLKKIKGLHYLRSNETELHLFDPYIRGLSFGYVGVGADQNYTLAAVAQPTHVWLMDYDPWVTRLHFIYRAIILASPTPADFIHTWQDRARVKRLLVATYGGDRALLTGLLWIYKKYRAFLKPYLRWSRRRKRNGKPTTWLSSGLYYKRVRSMWQEGRFQPLTGDLHGNRVLQGIAAAAKRLKIPIRIVYLSNAEMYLPYSSQFIANMKALPWDARTLVVRTVRGKRYRMKSDRWHYNIQPFGGDFLRRLATGQYRRIHVMMRDFDNTPGRIRRPLQRPRGFSRFTRDVVDRKTLLERMRAGHRRRRRRRARRDLP